jgi:hypothetical protein
MTNGKIYNKTWQPIGHVSLRLSIPEERDWNP